MGKYTREELRAMAREVMDGVPSRDPRSEEVVRRLRLKFGMGYIETLAAIARLT